MAIESAAATVPLSPGERLNGLNHIAELRAKVFGLNIESELERFIKDMRDPRDINNEQNKRALAACCCCSQLTLCKVALVGVW